MLLTDGGVLSLSCVAQENSQDLTQTLGETSVACRGKSLLAGSSAKKSRQASG